MTKTIEQLREDVERQDLEARLKDRAAEARSAKHVRDSRLMRVWDDALMEGWGDLIDPLEYLKDDPGYGPYGRIMVPSALISDREHGQNFPFWRTEQELGIIRGAAKVLATTSPAAIGATRNLTNFVVGRGFQYKAVPVKGETLPIGLIELVQRVINEFIKENTFNCGIDREMFIRGMRDGESINAMWHVGGGHAVHRFIEPEQLTEPKDPDRLQEQLGFLDLALDWKFGKVTKASDVCDTIGYHLQWDTTGEDCDFLDASRVVHVKRNVDANIKRGCSDFYAVQSHIEDAEKLLKNVRKTTAILAAIAIIREHAAGVTQATAAKMVSDATEAQQQRPTQWGMKTESITRYPPGATIDTPKGQLYKPSPIAAGFGESIIAVEQAVLRMAGVRWCMPEYMISGDASNANFASTMVAESPFVRSAEVEQETIGNPFVTVLWRAVEIASNAGRFAKFGIDFDTLYQVVDINATPPRVASRDTLKETQANMLLKKNGVLSLEDWAAREGLNYQEQKDKGAVPDPTPTMPGSDAGGAPSGVDGGITGSDDDPANPTLEAILEGDTGCGDGADGFGTGNKCAKGGGDGGGAKESSKTPRPKVTPEDKKKYLSAHEEYMDDDSDAATEKFNKIQKELVDKYGEHAIFSLYGESFDDDEPHTTIGDTPSKAESVQDFDSWKKVTDTHGLDFTKKLQKTLESLDVKQKNALNMYQTYGSLGINETLRSGDKFDDEDDELSHKALLTAVDKAGALPKPITTYRGMGFIDTTHKKTFMNAIKKAYTSGLPYVAKSYTSSSLDEDMTRTFMNNASALPDEVDEGASQLVSPLLMHITAKSGLYGDTVEQELIQKPGTKYRVTKVEDGDDLSGKPTIVHVEEV